MSIHSLQFKDDIYQYTIQEVLEKHEATGGLMWLNTLEVVLEGQKSYPLRIEFLAKDDYYMGNTLTKEIVEDLNLTYPSVVQQLIRFAITKGWNTSKEGLFIQNGMEALRQIGYDIKPIHVDTETIHELLIEPIVFKKKE